MFREPTIQYQELTSPVRFPTPVPAFLDIDYPSYIDRKKIHASGMPAFFFRNYIEGFPVPAHSWDGNYPDRIDRKRIHAARVQSYAHQFALSNYPVPPLSWEGVFPDRIFRRFTHSSRAPFSVANVLPLPNPTAFIDWKGTYPDKLYKLRIHPSQVPYTSALQLDLPNVAPPLSWDGNYPDRIHRGRINIAEIPFQSERWLNPPNAPVPTFFKGEIYRPLPKRWIHPALLPYEFLIPFFTDTPIPFDANRKLLAIVDISETWTSHFATRGWASIQDQVDAGYPLYCHPTLTTGSYEEVYDIGTILENTVITFQWSTTLGSGTINVVPKLAVSDDGITYTPFNTGSTLFAESVRYVKFRLEFSAVGDKNASLYYTLTLNLSTKREMDGGTVDVLAADAGGTIVNFNKAFKDVETITTTPLSTVEQVAIYDFVDIPNPVSFKILLYNTAGARIDGTVSWKARGIV